MRRKKMIAKNERENALICYQMLSTNYLRKCMEISLEDLWISELTGLN